MSQTLCTFAHEMKLKRNNNNFQPCFVQVNIYRGKDFPPRKRSLTSSARHVVTHAALLLALGVNLYVVIKILGHKSIESAQVCADVLMDTKIEAVNIANGVFLS